MPDDGCDVARSQKSNEVRHQFDGRKDDLPSDWAEADWLQLLYTRYKNSSTNGCDQAKAEGSLAGELTGVRDMGEDYSHSVYESESLDPEIGTLIRNAVVDLDGHIRFRDPEYQVSPFSLPKDTLPPNLKI
jgi:hypothetical protein